jgi:hypothetical protein
MAEKRLEAMRHPLRAAVLRILDERAASPVEMARELKQLDVSGVSYHTKRLVELDCAELVYERKVRGAVEHVYRGTERHLLDLEQWQELVEANPEIADHLVGEFMQLIIDDFGLGLEAKVGRDENFHITRTPMVLDLEGLQEGVKAYERFRLEMLEVQDRALARGGRNFPVSSSLALFRTGDY